MDCKGKKENKWKKIIWYGKINITFSEKVMSQYIIPQYMIINLRNNHIPQHDIFHYYTSRQFPIQNFHRRTTDIL